MQEPKKFFKLTELIIIILEPTRKENDEVEVLGTRSSDLMEETQSKCTTSGAIPPVSNQSSVSLSPQRSSELS